MATWESIYESRIVTPDGAAAKIQSGQRIFLTGNCSVPQKVLAALVKYAPNLQNVEICQALTVGPVPAREALTVNYTLPGPGRLVCALIDVRGRVVRRLEAGPRPAGAGRLRWTLGDGSGPALAPGVYFLRLFHGGQTVGKRVVVTR